MVVMGRKQSTAIDRIPTLLISASSFLDQRAGVWGRYEVNKQTKSIAKVKEIRYKRS